MIPFDDLVTSLERFKLRKSTPGAVPVVSAGGNSGGNSGGKVVSGKPQTRQASLADLGDDLISEE